VGHRSEKIMPAELQPELGVSEFYCGTASGGLANRQSVPIIHCTDLFHPPDDPDDHVDLAVLFALSELDILAIILDLGHLQEAKPGDVPVRQMMTFATSLALGNAGLGC
jgi:hypothetical protein